MTRGKIILLNGATSAGKTSIIRELQPILDDAYLEAGIDKFLYMLPDHYLTNTQLWHKIIGYYKTDHGELIPTVGTHGHQLMRGMHRAIAALAQSGNNVVSDHVLLDQLWREDCVAVFQGLEVLFVGVTCPLDVLEAREQARGDRTLGHAKGQASIVHQNCDYDLELDTSVLSPLECAQRVKQRLLRGNFTTFEHMRNL